MCCERCSDDAYLLADRRLPSWLLPSAAFYFDLEAAFQTTPPLGVITWLVKEGAVVPQGVLWQCIHELKMEQNPVMGYSDVNPLSKTQTPLLMVEAAV